jgi:hypothetical protein
MFSLPFYFVTSVIFITVPCVCPVCNIWFEYPQLLFLFRVASMWSIYPVLKVRPVSPICPNGGSRPLIYRSRSSSVNSWKFIVMTYWLLRGIAYWYEHMSKLTLQQCVSVIILDTPVNRRVTDWTTEFRFPSVTWIFFIHISCGVYSKSYPMHNGSNFPVRLNGLRLTNHIHLHNAKF